MLTKKRIKEHLGVGPLYVGSIVLLTGLIVFFESQGFFANGKIPHLKMLFIITGTIFLLIGIIMRIAAVWYAKINQHINKNILMTKNIYAIVRNPIYSAFMFGAWGTLLMLNNYFVLPFFPIYRGTLTILLKNTEEKQLLKHYGKEYLSYCKKTNRCIPWFQKKEKADLSKKED